MKPLHAPSLLTRWAKVITPLITRTIMRAPLAQWLSLSESYLAFVQGKGSGSGWDLQGEVRVAVAHIHRPDAVIFDVGANMGEWSVALLEALRSDKCRIFQFEPAPYCQERLSVLNLPRTTLIRAAVSDCAGKVAFFSPDAWATIGSLYPRRDSHVQQYSFQEMQVPTVTLDETIEKFEIDAVDFMKMDIEGSELAALKGSRAALESKKLKAFTFEFGSANINSRTFLHDYWDLIRSYGYEIKRICPGNILLPIEHYDESLEYFRSVTNYLAVAQGDVG